MSRYFIRPINPDFSEEAGRLQDRLVKFYNSSTDYYDKAEETTKERWYERLRDYIPIRDDRRTKVLEIGCGRSAFPSWLDRVGLRHRIEFTGQDVTPLNEDYLRRCCDDVHIGHLKHIKGNFDFIFSTFVYEHLAFPKEMVETCISLLNKDGVLVIISPCYTMPGYVPPAIRHLPRPTQYLLSLQLVFSNITSLLTRSPNFAIVRDPALFHRGYFRDSDAIHMVSPFDIDLAFPELRKEKMAVPYTGFRTWVWAKFLMFANCYRRR